MIALLCLHVLAIAVLGYSVFQARQALELAREANAMLLAQNASVVDHAGQVVDHLRDALRVITTAHNNQVARAEALHVIARAGAVDWPPLHPEPEPP